MTEYTISKAENIHMGQINLVKIQADLETFGSHYPSFTFSHEDLSSAIKDENVFIVLSDNQVVAFIKFMQDFNQQYVYLDQVSVLAGHQRQGLAKKLMSKMIQKAKKGDVLKIGLATSKETPWGQKLYSHIGFKELPVKNAPENWQAHISEEIEQSSKDKLYMELGV